MTQALHCQTGDSDRFTKTISESDIYLFAGRSGDFYDAHINEAAMADAMFGGRIRAWRAAGGIHIGRRDPNDRVDAGNYCIRMQNVHHGLARREKGDGSMFKLNLENPENPSWDKKMIRSRPASKSTFSKFVPLTPRWNDIDVFGHVNNAEFYAWFDTAALTYLNSIDDVGPRNNDIAVLVVESCAQFNSEVLFSDKVEIGLGISHVGTSSVRYKLGVFCNDQSQSAVDGAFTHVFVDKNTRRPVPVPDRFRTQFLNLTLEVENTCKS